MKPYFTAEEHKKARIICSADERRIERAGPGRAANCVIMLKNETGTGVNGIKHV